MNCIHKLSVVGLLGCLSSVSSVQSAEMSVADVRMQSGRQALVVVSGSVQNELTYGVTTMVELIPRAGAKGTVEFTTVGVAKPKTRGSYAIHRNLDRPDEVRTQRAENTAVDIAQQGDPWPDRGTFKVFDTDRTFSRRQNGTVDDNGTFLAESLTFAGVLSSFPIKASPNAEGVWDVLLVTSDGSSSWAGAPTQLLAGTITVARDACMRDRDCMDRDPCTVDKCVSGACQHVRSEGPCGGRKPGKDRNDGRNR